MNVHAKINFRVNHNDIPIGSIIKQNYNLVIDVTDAMKHVYQIPVDEYDVISGNPLLFIHKDVRGKHFTYKVSDNKDFGHVGVDGYKVRAGEMGVRIIYKPIK